MRKLFIPLLLPLIPVMLGLALGALWQSGAIANPVLVLRVDVGSLMMIAGVCVGILLAAGVALLAASARLEQKAIAQLRTEQAESHRRFIRRLDHEVKNPLTAIRAGLANVRGEPGSEPALASVRAQVDRLARLSADLRKLADLERRPIEREPVELGELLAELIELAHDRPGAGARRLQLTIPQAPWPLPPVAGDRDLLFLAAHNLVDNALKYSRPGDTIEVRAFEDGPWVVVEVADTGPGVPAEELPHLGEELFRGSVTRSVEGSGLGLALARAIVERHGGSIRIRSRLRQGTAVSLRLPASR